MKKIVAVLAMTFAAFFAYNGVANATPSVVGQTVAEAKQALNEAGTYGKVFSQNGSAGPRSECVVTGQFNVQDRWVVVGYEGPVGDRSPIRELRDGGVGLHVSCYK